jgi:hypothetical protein
VSSWTNRIPLSSGHEKPSSLRQPLRLGTDAQLSLMWQPRQHPHRHHLPPRNHISLRSLTLVSYPLVGHRGILLIPLDILPDHSSHQTLCSPALQQPKRPRSKKSVKFAKVSGEMDSSARAEGIEKSVHFLGSLARLGLQN